MKKIVIYDFWMMMLAWSLFLNNFQYAGILMALACAVYNFFVIRHMNHWRLFSITLISSLVGILVLRSTEIAQIYRCIFPFLMLMMIDCALVNEICCALSAEKIVGIDILLSFTTLFSVAAVCMIPESPLLPFYKSNLFGFIVMIFFPSFSEMNICLVSKLLTKKHPQRDVGKVNV